MNIKPELPEPTCWLPSEKNYFTESQLLAYRGQVIEMCADIVDNAPTPDCGGWTACGISEAIRSLKND
jgi:hypothetical protein